MQLPADTDGKTRKDSENNVFNLGSMNESDCMQMVTDVAAVYF